MYDLAEKNEQTIFEHDSGRNYTKVAGKSEQICVEIHPAKASYDDLVNDTTSTSSADSIKETSV